MQMKKAGKLKRSFRREAWIRETSLKATWRREKNFINIKSTKSKLINHEIIIH